MNTKNTHTTYVSFEEIFGHVLYDMFSPKSKNSLINYKELKLVNTLDLKNLVDWKELKGLVKWSDLRLVNMKLLVEGFQYIGAISFLALFFTSLALSILIDEYSYKTKLAMSRADRQFAMEKAIFDRSGQNYALNSINSYPARVIVVNSQTSVVPTKNELAMGYVLGANTTEPKYEQHVENTMLPVDSDVSVKMEDSELASTEVATSGNAESFYRSGICSFTTTDGVLYSSGSTIQPKSAVKVCVKAVNSDSNLKANLVSETGSDKPLNLTQDCFSASKIEGASMISVSVVGADNVSVGGCNLLVSAL